MRALCHGLAPIATARLFGHFEMDLQDAIARHEAARAKLAAFKAARMNIDAATFEELSAEALSALELVVDAPEEDADGFFEKLRYLSAFEASKQRYASPAIWQINGSILVFLWRRFGWSETNRPNF